MVCIETPTRFVSVDLENVGHRGSCRRQRSFGICNSSGTRNSDGGSLGVFARPRGLGVDRSRLTVMILDLSGGQKQIQECVDRIDTFFFFFGVTVEQQRLVSRSA